MNQYQAGEQGYSRRPPPPPVLQSNQLSSTGPPPTSFQSHQTLTANGIPGGVYNQSASPPNPVTNQSSADNWNQPPGQLSTSSYPAPPPHLKESVMPAHTSPTPGYHGQVSPGYPRSTGPPVPSHQHSSQPSFNSYPQSSVGSNVGHYQQPIQGPHHLQQQQQQQQQYPSQYNGFTSGGTASLQNYPLGGFQGQMRTSQPARSSYNNGVDQVTGQIAGMSVNNNWSQMWNQRSINLMTEKNVLNLQSPDAPTPDEDDSCCCDREIMRPTMAKVPESSSLLQKSRLPFGILLHPFKDDDEMPIIQDRTIVRCRSCRTYINPFIRLLEQRRWQCNLCNRVNDLPEDFLVDPQTKQYLEYPPRQPELMYGSVEFIAPVEYMVRPPQPAAYVFVFDCSAHAYHLGYIPILARAIRDNLDMIPGDSRTLVGFVGFDSKVHFFCFGEKQASHLLVPDIEDIFLPNPDNLLVNLRSKREVIEQFLTEMLPNFPANESTDPNLPPVFDTGSALGPAVSVAYKILSPIGGRVTVFQATLPNMGREKDGNILFNREDPNIRSTENNSARLTPLINPSTDFFKKLALECSEHQVAVDLFCLSPSYCDLASVSQVSKISGGSIFYYGQSVANLGNCKEKVLCRLEDDLTRYLTRNIGFEAVLRLRCTRGLSIHSFHGNCFVRSTDLLTLPNVNPDSGYAVQISIEEDLRDFHGICFQAAVLYTNASGERRIRVHTLALPLANTVHDVITGADAEAIVGLLSKMAVDRSRQASVADAREAATNAVVDLLGTYKALHPAEACAGLVTSVNTRLLPLYILAMLKNPAFRVGVPTRIDERVAAMEAMKNLPLCYLMTYIYPDLYPVHATIDYENEKWPQPLHLTFGNIDRSGVYILDSFDSIYLYICKSVHPEWISQVFGVSQWQQIPDDGDVARNANGGKLSDINSTELHSLPELENHTSAGLRSFVESLMDSRPFRPNFFIIREDSVIRRSFTQHMHDDRDESAFSYYEYLQHLQQQIKN